MNDTKKEELTPELKRIYKELMQIWVKMEVCPERDVLDGVMRCLHSGIIKGD